MAKMQAGELATAMQMVMWSAKAVKLVLLVGHSSGSITNSYANGEVSGEANGVGGLVGANHGEIAKQLCHGQRRRQC